MRFPFLAASVSALLFGLGAVPVGATPTARQANSFSLVDGEPIFTFHYASTDPDSTNWVGLYDAAGGGPVDEVYVADALVWDYAPETDSTIHLPVSSLQPGQYQVFFLAKDGYKWLADPIDVTLPNADGPVSFIVKAATLQNARQGDAFKANISGLTRGGGDSTISFAIVEADGAKWVKVSSDGTISGTPGSSEEAQVVVEATADNSTTRLGVTIPVRSSGEPLVPQVNVMTYNLWHGGTQVNNYHEKQVRFLVESNVDLVGFQESTGNHASRLATALGWYSWQGSDCGIISRYPIVETYPELAQGGAVRIALDGEESQINFWNVHLGYDPYGPYDFCFDHMTVEEVLKREAQSNRTPQIIDTVAAMKDHLANSDSIPVLLTGDFNAPSHLDYTEALREKNCGYANVPWPTSEHPTEAGLVDSYRVIHPDPAKKQGITWSPIFLDNEGRPEPLDRIDFIYHKGKVSVIESNELLVGNPAPEPNHADNEWTSDHKAVMTVYKLSNEAGRQLEM